MVIDELCVWSFLGKVWDLGFKVQDYVITQHLVAKQENFKLNIIQQTERELIYSNRPNGQTLKKKTLSTLIMCRLTCFFFQIVDTACLKQ